MTDLTEQWKKGELPEGWYWCKCYDEETKLLYYDGDCFELDDPETKNYYFFLKKDGAEIEILEEVPTFEEWQASEKYNKHLEEVIKIYERKDKQVTETSIAYNELLEEYQKLKESRAELNSDIADKAYENAMLKSEYEKECKRADELEDSYWKSEKENKKLKELLKECKDTMNKAGYLFAKIDDVKKTKRLLKQIEEVLK